MSNEKFMTKPSYIENPPMPPVTKKEKTKKLNDNLHFKHYKGAIYTVIGIGKHTESGERLVAYYDSDGEVHFRPEEMFFGIVEIDGIKMQRFTPITAPSV